MNNKIPAFLLKQPSAAPFVRSGGNMKMSYLEKGINQLAQIIKSGYMQWDSAAMDGFFQKIDARIKVIFLLFYIVTVSLIKDIMPEVMLGGSVFILALVSRLNMFSFYKRILLLGVFFRVSHSASLGL